MESDRAPFLSMEEKAESSMEGDSNVHQTQRQRHPRYILFYALIYLMASWGCISLFYHAYQLLSTSKSAPSLDPEKPPKTVPTSDPLNICNCGTTIQEALSLNCVYDSLSAAWLPPYCRDDELTAQFERAGPGPNGTWNFFYDENGTMPIPKAEIAALGEAGGSFWASEEWHAAHCLFYWQKYYRMRETGVVIEARFDSLHHVKHCTQLIMDPGPGYFVLIEVPVVMNSSTEYDELHLSHTDLLCRKVV
ncbi:hypothetical protein BO71DRAFT_484097 [Aspergillus ellipticus CBS 707.79]|uniref:Uncharacterized protein n=1 Tax=Aspergillus ellipticus CBS 707.79 TaxID=1448320 RepID=A0A319DRZ1_9EURO|nr:hypothetical protein BO71DRAFT_484097 [Aspergillus ellipticus CBS 707.79]